MKASTSSTKTTMADKRKFKKQKKADQQNVDRLSDLPDLALGAIVSFLPFKEAGRTSVLSKRWNGIWRFAMDNVERFDEYVLYRPLPLTSIASKRHVIRRQYFINFVKNYVLSNNPQKELNTFHFSFSNPNHFKLDVDRLISYAISKNVKDFDLDFSCKEWKKHRADDYGPFFELPEAFYQHVLIESLKLSACNLRVPYLSKLRGLKNLSLDWIELYPLDLQRVLINCELLESLALKRCNELGTIDIMLPNSSRLTSFVVDDCSSLCEMWLHIPTLRYFKYFGALVSFSIENLRDIEEADFDFGVETDYNDLGDQIIAILRHIDNLRILTVCSYIIQVIVTANDTPLFMPDLRHLTLKTELTDVELLGVAHLLRSCPDLESLTIRLEPATRLKGCEKVYTFDCHNFWKIYGIPIPPCLPAKLREVRIEGYPGKINHLSMLHFLLANCGGLRRVTIVLPWMMKEKDKEGTKKQLLQFISQVNKASMNVLIQVL